jgi:hypothetical protein
MRKAFLLVLSAAFVLSFTALAFGKLPDEKFEELKKRVNSGAAKNPSGIKQDILDLARDDSSRAVSVLADINRKALDDMDVVAVLQRALSSMSSNEAHRAIVSKTSKVADYRMRIILIEICTNISGDEATRAIAGCLDDRQNRVAITAARALGQRGSLDAIEPLIKQMEKMAKKKKSGTRLYSDIRKALEQISGQKDLYEAQDWRNWYNAHKDKIVPGGAGGQIETARPMVGDIKTVSFFGLQIDSRRIIFVIDVSGSMKIPDPPPENWVPDADLGDQGKGTQLEKEKDPTLKKKLEKERERMKDPKVWGEKRKRIVRTKKELVKVLKALQGTVKFNIVSFSDQINSFGKSLQKATSGTKSKSVKWVEKLTADGLTHTDRALQEAFKDKEMDTIVLLSDGAPTHIGGDAKAEWNGHQDSQQIIDSIYAWLKKENKFRKITIHTLGFTGANFEFMQKLSQMTGGKFREIK